MKRIICENEVSFQQLKKENMNKMGLWRSW